MVLLLWKNRNTKTSLQTSLWMGWLREKPIHPIRVRGLPCRIFSFLCFRLVTASEWSWTPICSALWWVIIPFLGKGWVDPKSIWCWGRQWCWSSGTVDRPPDHKIWSEFRSIYSISFNLKLTQTLQDWSWQGDRSYRINFTMADFGHFRFRFMVFCRLNRWG